MAGHDIDLANVPANRPPRIVVRDQNDDSTAAVGAVPTANLLLLDGSGRILLGLRAPEDQQEPGLWNLPGGKCEAGERAIDAALRETFEEFSITLSEADLRLFVRYRCIYPDRLVDADYFAARVPGTVEFTFNQEEFSQGGFFDLREAAGWKLAFRQEVVLQALLDSEGG